MGRYMRLLILLVVLLAAPFAAADELKVTLDNWVSDDIEVSFHAQGREKAWPGDRNVWKLKGYDHQSYSLACMPGEKICYGAWMTGASSRYWGSGEFSKRSCTDCCMTCGGTYTYKLTADNATKLTSDTAPVSVRSDQLIAMVRSLDPKAVGLKFFSADRRRVWPTADRMYPLRDSKFHTFSLECTPGQKICYGAWREGADTISWGVGRAGNKGCSNCCMTCGSGPHKHTLEAGPERAPDPPNQVAIEMRSLDEYALELSFFTEDGSRAWPGGNQIYPLKDSQFHSYRLTCTPGEKICYGAWRAGNSKIYWGSGYANRQACSNCCFRCGGGAQRITLNAYQGSSGGGSAFSEIVGGVLAGAAAGIGAAGRVRAPAQPNFSPRVRQSPAFPSIPPKQYRQSDISGTR